MSESSLDTVRRLYAFLADDNFVEANKMMADDVIFRETTDLPFGDVYYGVDGLTELMGKIAEVAKISVVSHDFLSETNPIVAHVVARFVSHATGEVVESDVIEVVHVKDGRCTEIDVYYKNPAAIAALWPKQ